MLDHMTPVRSSSACLPLRTFALLLLVLVVVVAAAAPVAGELRVRNASARPGPGNSSAWNGADAGLDLDGDLVVVVDDDDDVLDTYAAENSLSIQAFLDSSIRVFDPMLHAISGVLDGLYGNVYHSAPLEKLGDGTAPHFI